MANYPPGPVVGGTDAPFSFATQSKTAPIELLNVWSEAITTSVGVGVGSTAAEVVAAYPESSPPQTVGTSELFVVRGQKSNLVFEVATGFVAGESTWEESDLGSVLRAYVLSDRFAPESLIGMQGGAHCLD